MRGVLAGRRASLSGERTTFLPVLVLTQAIINKSYGYYRHADGYEVTKTTQRKKWLFFGRYKKPKVRRVFVSNYVSPIQSDKSRSLAVGEAIAPEGYWNPGDPTRRTAYAGGDYVRQYTQELSNTGGMIKPSIQYAGQAYPLSGRV